MDLEFAHSWNKELEEEASPKALYSWIKRLPHSGSHARNTLQGPFRSSS